MGDDLNPIFDRFKVNVSDITQSDVPHSPAAAAAPIRGLRPDHPWFSAKGAALAPAICPTSVGDDPQKRLG